MDRTERAGVIYVVIAGICWGLIGLFTRTLSAAGFNSLQITFLRNLFAAAGMFAVILVTDRNALKISLKDIWMFLGTGICSVAFFNICYFKALEMTTMSVAAVLLYTAPCMVMVMSCVFFKEKITIQKILALVLAFAGCVFTTGLAGDRTAVSAMGILIGLGSGFGYALYSIFGTVATRKYNTFTITFYTFLLAAAGLAPFCRPGEVISLTSAEPSMLWVAVMLAVFSTVVPFIFYTKGLKVMDAGKASVMAFIEPMVATICGIVVFHEKMTPGNAAGVALIFISIVLLNIRTKAK